MRAFLAVDPSDEAIAHLQEARAALAAALPGWRVVRPGSVHLTLRFLGELDAETDRRLRDGWRDAAASCRRFRLTTGTLDAFPSRGAPRVVWCTVGEPEPAGALEELAASLERAAVRGGLTAESRAFRPHLTLARRGRAAPARRDALPSLAPGPSFDVRAVTLYRSRLEPSGARYTVLESFPLDDEGHR